MVSLSTTLGVALVLTAAALLQVSAWAPTSHYLFTCEGLFDKPGCINDPKYASLMSGTEMPDAFFFANFVTGNPCSEKFAILHDPLFAGFLVTAARNYTGLRNSTFNATAFAYGYGAHVVADAAGFLPGGYLGTGGEKRALNPMLQTTNWVSLWPFMTAVDGYVNHNLLPAGSKYPKLLQFGSEAWGFVAKANEDFVKEFPTYPAVSVAEASECASHWSTVIEIQSKKVSVMPAASFEFEMIHNDNFGAANFSQAVDHFNMAKGCAIKSVKVWANSIEKSLNPSLAVNVTLGFLEKEFLAGNCAPPPHQKRVEFKQYCAKPDECF